MAKPRVHLNWIDAPLVQTPDAVPVPLIVLSNNDGRAVARIPEAKALGVRLGDPYFKIRGLWRAQGTRVFSTNDTLFSDVSGRTDTVYRQLSPQVEICSTDESFLNPSDVAPALRVDLARDLRDLDPSPVRESLTVVGERIIHDPRGMACLPLEMVAARRKAARWRARSPAGSRSGRCWTRWWRHARRGSARREAAARGARHRSRHDLLSHERARPGRADPLGLDDRAAAGARLGHAGADQGGAALDDAGQRFAALAIASCRTRSGTLTHFVVWLGRLHARTERSTMRRIRRTVPVPVRYGAVIWIAPVVRVRRLPVGLCQLPVGRQRPPRSGGGPQTKHRRRAREIHRQHHPRDDEDNKCGETHDDAPRIFASNGENAGDPPLIPTGGNQFMSRRNTMVVGGWAVQYRVVLAKSKAETPIRLLRVRDLARSGRKRVLPPSSERKEPV